MFDRKNVKDIYRLSPMQQGMLFHTIKDQKNQVYFEQLSFDIEGSVNIDCLIASVNALIEKYDVLRTIFLYEKIKRPMQIVLKNREASVYTEDISNMPEAQRSAYLKEYKKKDRERGFDLSRDLLIRFSLFKTGESTNLLLISSHHILMDGWCMDVVLSDLFNFYYMYLNNLPVKVEKTIPYSSFIRWLDEQNEEEARSFWKNYLHEYKEISRIPYHKLSNSSENVREELHFGLGESLTGQLQQLANMNQVTMNTLIQTFWGILLQKLNDTRDVVFGSVVSGRPSEIYGVEKIVGLFINTIPVRVSATEEETLVGLIKKVQEQSLLAGKYDYLSLADIQSNGEVSGMLFDHIMAFENYPVNSSEQVEHATGGIGFTVTGMEAYEQTNYDLAIQLHAGEELNGKITYNGAVYPKELIKRLPVYLEKLAQVAVESPLTAIGDISLATEEELKIFEKWNQTTTDYPKDKVLSELFEEQAKHLPEQIALVFGERSITYREVNEKANQIAKHLQKSGVSRGKTVALLMERSAEMIISMLGILKAGGAYLPIDPTYPSDRIQYMLEDSGTDHLVVQVQKLIPNFFKGHALVLEEGEWMQEGKDDLAKENVPDDTAYIIYTSGTTGRPKGCQISHRNVIKTIKNNGYIEITTDDRFLQLLNYAFDGSVFDIYSALLNGARLVLAPNKAASDLKEIARLMKEENITISLMTTALFNVIVDEQISCLKNLRKVLMGGEKASIKHVRKAVNYLGDNRIINVYGPTETTVFAATYEADHQINSLDCIPIGRSINNTQLYVVSQSGHLQPMGVSGELYIGGDGVGKGYLNQSELTNKFFIDNPFGEGKVYKTGDLVRWLPNGNLEYLGRSDQQVKLRGHRIELSEIEARLAEYPGIQNCVVALKGEGSNGSYLYAYYVAELKVETVALKKFLQEKLPSFMIPARFVQLDEIPLTSNGKVDKGSLPEIQETHDPRHQKATTQLEQQLVVLYQEVLNREKIGIYDNFFELGGHSLKLMMLTSRISKELAVDISFRDVYANQTVKQLADHINSLEKNIFEAINPALESEFYPVSYAQKRMYLVQEIEGDDSTHYNMPIALEIKGALQKTKVETIMQSLVDRHESLRTSFHIKDEQIVQKIHQRVDFQFEIISSSGRDESVLVEQFVRPFNLQSGSLFRAALIEKSSEDFILCLDMHHIISDGVSANILFQEFVSLYRNEKLPELSVQYKDYSVWQQREDQKQKIQEQEAFWLNRFTGEIPVLDMPSDFPERADKLSKGETFHTEINATLLEKLRDLSIRSGTTLFTTLLASFHIFLSKYTSQEDIVVGTPISGRGHTDLERIVGMFVNTLAIRLQSNSSLTFNEFLAKVKNETVLAFDHAEYPFEMLVEKLNLYRNSGSNPLIHTIFTLQSESSSADGIPDLTVTPYEWEWGNSKYDFTLAATEGESLRISVEYNTGKFKRSTIKRMLKHFEWILEQITKNPDMLLKSIEIATPHEKDMVLEQFNSTYKHIPTNKTIHQLFEEQAEKAPGYPAVIYKDEVLTYGELNNQSNKLAKMLRKAGVGPETVVGVIMNPSLEMVVSTLAILKSGGAFLPIDPKLPVGRQVYMLEDSSADHLVVHTLNQIPESYGGNTFCLEQLSSSNEDEPNLESIIKPDNLAYVIYTSGTTGRPKGVMVEHLSLVNLCFWHNHEFQVMPKDRSAKLAGFGFDASVWEIFPYLIAGSSIYIVEDDIRGDAVALNSYFEKNEITISFLPTQLAEQFIPLNNSSLRILLIGGEKVRKVSSAPYRIVNNYGPTENTVVATSCTLFENQMEYPIGQPIWNNQILILSPDGNVQPVGIPGELYIAGRGLARGYMNNPSLTEERFVKNPYSDGKMYSTGDVARWLPDGKIEFLGRQDNQVKIRGFRIEINEIESCLLQYPSIREAVVLAHESESKRYYLCAYIVSSNKADYSEIRRFLLEQLPEYMVPAHVIQLDHIPLNPNGKIDKKKLLEVKEFTLPVSKYTAPSNPLEKKLVAIFKDVLKVEQIGVHDNFFERGGHSLNATILLSRIHKQLNIGIKLREFFANPTVSGTAQLMRQEKNTRYLSIQKAAERPSYPASAAQKRMFIVEQLDAQNDGTNYNMPIVMEAKGNLSAENVEKAFKSLIARHEALRTSFHLEDNHLTQVIHHQDIPWSLDVVRASESEIENLVNKFIVPFDLQKAPLFRAVLLEISPDRQLIMMDMHHIIADGISANILLRDFCALYQGHSLPDITLNYKDFAVWQQEDEQIEKLKTDEEYWLNMLSGELPVLDLPTDFTRPPVRQFKGETLEFSVDSSILKKLKELSASEGATLYMTLLAAYNVLLSKYTEKEDIIVGSPIAGRPHADLEEVVGVFINVLALRNRPEGSLSFREFLANVRTETLKSYEYSNYPFEELVEKLDLKRDFSRNPIFDTTFSLQNFDLDIAIGEELQFKPYEIEWKSSKFDLSWICQEGESLYITLEYSTSLFTQDTIERMRDHFLHLLYQIVEDPEQKLSDMILVTEEEKHQLLYTFNQTEKPFPNGKAIHQLFEEQVQRTPELVAVVFGDEQLTYRELNSRANQLARLLRERGTVREELVGIMVDRSLEMIVGILGVLKAGGAYVPLDPSYPEERIRYILEDSGVQRLLTQSSVKIMEGFTGETILIDQPHVYNGADENLEHINQAEDLAYVIYTSGSTGKPKGVLIEHRGVSNLQLMAETYGIREGSRVLQFASCSFDASVEEIFHTLLVGATLFICSKEQLLSGEEFVRYLEIKSINTLTVPPSYLRALPQSELPSLTTLVTAGEPCSKELIAQWGYNRRFINAYGPTEATVCTTLSDEVEEKVSIGRPINNKKVYIINPLGQLQPIGVPGELCIGGEGLARGYLNQPSLTAERFIDHPLLPGARIYCTGDQARWLPDGRIEYLGRQDEQVKIRGYRIEIGEIEATLLNFPDVKDVKVICREDTKGNTSLCAYVVLSGELEAGELRRYLASKLPEFMIPEHFLQLDSFPFTSNGKIDKNRLPSPKQRRVGKYTFSFSDPIEQKLSDLWEEILDVPNIGINDNFFELGGQSLKGIIFVSRLQQELNIKLTLNDLFLYPILKDLADSIRNRMNTEQYSFTVQDPIGSEIKGIGTANFEPSYKIPAYVKPELYTEQEVLIGSGDIKIPATLTIPKKKGPIPVVILIPGDGEVDRDSRLYALKPFKDIALGLASQNIAVLRYEKRTNKRFKFFKDYTVSDEFTEDAVQAVKFLRETDKIEVDDIFLVGHCRGGWMLPDILDRKEMEGIAGGVVLSAPNPQVSAVEMLLNKTDLPGLSSEELKLCREQLRMIQYLPIDKINPEKFRLAPSVKWWHSLKDYIPSQSPILKDFPFLVLQGGRDINITEDDFEKWKEVLSENRNAVFSYYKKLNHAYVEGEGPGTMEEYLLPGNVPEYIVEEIGNWIKEKIKVVN